MRVLLAAAACAVLSACAGGAIGGLWNSEHREAGPGDASTSGATIAAALADPRRPDTDRVRDELRRPAEVLAFAQVRPGMRIADVGPGGGYYTRLFSVTAGEGGAVFAVDRPNTPERTRAILAVAPAYPNVTVIQQGYQSWSAGEPLDAIFISQIYHDFHLPALALDVPALNRSLYAALKPGGALVIIDHAAIDGSDLSVTDTLHRIDEATVRRELAAAGFVFEAESQMLRNPADTRTERVFEADIRGHTDQFALRFRKPN